jgi:hypothetical protein
MDEAGYTHGPRGYPASPRRRRGGGTGRGGVPRSRALPASRIIQRVSSPLSGIAVDKRRRLAATLGLFAMLFIAVGAVAATGADTAIVKGFVVVALLVALALALMAWGVAHSVKADSAELRLDAAIEEAVKARGGSMCDCGHEHDPTELHVTDDPCAQDGTGAACTHTCDTCVLSQLRPSPTNEMAGTRPSPGPKRRPSPSPR